MNKKRPPTSVLVMNITTQKKEMMKKKNLNHLTHFILVSGIWWPGLAFVGDSSEAYPIAWIPFLKAMARIGLDKRYVHNDYALTHLCVWETPVNANTPWPCDMWWGHGGTIIYHITPCQYCKCEDFHERLSTENGHPYKCSTCHSSFTSGCHPQTKHALY